MKKRLKPKYFWLALRRSVSHFSEYKIPKKSASLAYYTTFSLAPIFYFILSLGGFFYGEEILQGQVFSRLQAFVGDEVAGMLQGILSRTVIEDSSHIATIVSAGTLLVAATGVFVEIQDSLNEIWSVEVKQSTGVWSFIKDRLLSFSIIVAFGFLFLVSLLINSAIDVVRDTIEQNLSFLSVVFTVIINNALLVAIISTLFYLIFKVLPDVTFANHISVAGAVLTTLLFLLGRYLIGLYLSNSNLGNLFGQGGTIVILLSWVYYTSMILYFGAAYTRHLAAVTREQVKVMNHAQFTKGEVHEKN